MNEILQGISIIKMYAWEKPFAKQISQARRSEVKIIRACYYLQAITHALEIILPAFSIFLSIIAFIYLGNNIKASIIYSVIAIFDALRPTITIMFSEGITNLAKVHVTISRIQNLLCEETDSNLVSTNSDNVISSNHAQIVLKNVSASWQISDVSELVLNNIEIDIQSNQLVVIIGSVGSGKTSLFHILLNQIPVINGTVKITGTTSYASQIPWLFSASVRQNILFGSSYDKERYAKVLKICALEPDMNCLPNGDLTVIGERGSTLSGGQKARINLARCIYKVADIYLLDDPLSAVDVKVGSKIFQECIKQFLHDKICIIITHQIQYLKNADKVIVLDEGEIIEQGSYEDLKSSMLNISRFLPNAYEDDKKYLNTTPVAETHLENTARNSPAFKEHAQIGAVTTKTYFTYFLYGGNIYLIILLFLCFIAAQVSESGYYFFISHWVDVEQEFVTNTTYYDFENTRFNLIYMCTGIILTIISLAIIQSLFFYTFFMKASINLHNTVFEKIIQATMSFFNVNPSGVILNRFSDDLGEVDEYIPGILADTLQISLQLVGVIVVTTIINYWFFLPSLGLLLIFFLLRYIYMKTSRSVKRIEGITRSPIFGHVSATLQGITTIRAFGVENLLKQEFDSFQDFHTSAWFLYISSNKAFTFWLDLICGVIASIIILSLLVYNIGYHGGDVGLVINEFLSLMGVLQWGMSQLSELENHMTSVERIIEYQDIETEPNRNLPLDLHGDWPNLGCITFKNVSMKYNESDIPVLKQLNFTIHAKEKIGVVGRTGAGKSSTIAALFQLYAIEGSIFIDDVDIKNVPLEILRKRIAIIPQEPFLFSGSIRYNLDPFEEYTDDILWSALEKVQLKEEIENSEMGLYYNIRESGANLSVGQKQLLCLARAIIRNNKILILDEATANVDPQTDYLIQETIRNKFENCTVVTIAHRLQTIMDSDKVLVMDGGKLKEYDHPYILAQDCNSLLYSMLHATGKTTSETLYQIAKDSYCKHIKTS